MLFFSCACPMFSILLRSLDVWEIPFFLLLCYTRPFVPSPFSFIYTTTFLLFLFHHPLNHPFFSARDVPFLPLSISPTFFHLLANSNRIIEMTTSPILFVIYFNSCIINLPEILLFFLIDRRGPFISVAKELFQFSIPGTFVIYTKCAYHKTSYIYVTFSWDITVRELLINVIYYSPSFLASVAAVSPVPSASTVSSFIAILVERELTRIYYLFIAQHLLRQVRALN